MLVLACMSLADTMYNINMTQVQFVDTHCHIHFPDYELPEDQVIASATAAGVTRLIAVGCTLEDSKLAIKLAARYDHVWASIGLHPHEGAHYVHDEDALAQFRALVGKAKVVAIGETGLDYYYNNAPREDQIKLLRFQLTIAQEYNLPVIFHVRDDPKLDPDDPESVWTDFWPIYDEFKPKGVIHCFSAGKKELAEILKRDLFVGLNGIMTFTNKADQLEAAKAVPLDKILLETDAPFLTPNPFRGTMCEPKHVAVTAEFLSSLRNESLDEFARKTTDNAVRLFNLYV